MHRHPDLVHVTRQGLHHARLWPVLHAVVYRSDVEVPAMNLKDAKRKHLRRRTVEHREALRGLPKLPRLSMDGVLAIAFANHIRQLTAPSADGRSRFVLVRAGDPLVPNLSCKDALQPPVLLAHVGGGFVEDCMPCPPSPSQPRVVCFKVVDAHLSRKHVIPTSLAAGGRFDQRALSVVRHVAVVDGGAENDIIISQSPSRSPDEAGVDVRILDVRGHVDWAAVRAGWQVCEPGDDSFLYLDGCVHASPQCEVSRVLGLLVSAQAFPGRSLGYKCSNDGVLGVLRELGELGILDCRPPVDMDHDPRPDWVFSMSGMKRLAFGVTLAADRRTAIGDIRPGVALRDLSAYELILKLQDEGWRWRPLTPRTKKLSHSLVDAPRDLTWHSGATVDRLYLLALLQGPELHERFGITDIPHYADHVVFRDLLRGVVQRAGDVAGALELTWAPDGLPMLDAAAGSEAALCDGVLAEDIDLADGGGDDRSDEVSEPDLVAEVVEPVAPPTHLALPPGGLPSVADLLKGGGVHWGCFLFTKKKSSYQATCPWHRKNATTGCRKTLSVTARRSPEVVISLLKLWCVSARSWQRQHEHVFYQDVSAHPPDDVLDQMLLDADLVSGPAPGTVVRDDEVGGSAAVPPEVVTRSPPPREMAANPESFDASASPRLFTLSCVLSHPFCLCGLFASACFGP